MERQGRRSTGGERALILAAERLFAERGIAGVPLREVNQAANQRNISASHYHFGSREGLVNAVLAHRLPPLDARRGRLLRRPARHRDLRFYLEAFIEPLVEELAPRREGNHYIRFMQQYERYRGSYAAALRLTPESAEIYAAIERLIGYLPAPVRRIRIGYLINMIHSVLATAEERMAGGEIAFADVPLIAANMIDMFVAALGAPLSVDTLALVDPAGSAAGGPAAPE